MNKNIEIGSVCLSRPSAIKMMFKHISYRNDGVKGESVQILGAVCSRTFGVVIHFVVDIQRPSGTNHWKSRENFMRKEIDKLTMSLCNESQNLSHNIWSLFKSAIQKISSSENLRYRKSVIIKICDTENLRFRKSGIHKIMRFTKSGIHKSGIYKILHSQNEQFCSKTPIHKICDSQNLDSQNLWFTKSVIHKI